MNDLKTLWGEIRSDQDLEIITGKQILESIRNKSISTISKLESKVKVRFWFCVFVMLVLTIIIPFVGLTAAQILLSILMVSYLAGGILIWQEYRLLKNKMNMDKNLLSTLKEYKVRIKTFVKYEEIVSLILYPISASAGFILGMFLFNSDTALLNEPKDWLLLLIPLLIFTPIFHFLNKKLNRMTFANQLKELDKSIEELEYGS